MTYINLSRHDARLGDGVRYRPARHLQFANALNFMSIVSQIRNFESFDLAVKLIENFPCH